MRRRIQQISCAAAAFGLALSLAAGEAFGQGHHKPVQRAQPRHAAPLGVARHPAPVGTPQHPAWGSQHPRQGLPPIVHPGDRARAQAMLRPAPRQVAPVRPGQVVVPRQNWPTTPLRQSTLPVAGRLPNAPAPMRAAPSLAQPNPVASQSVDAVRPPSNAIGQRTTTARSQVIVETDYAAASGPPIAPSPAGRQPASTAITTTQYQGRSTGQSRIPRVPPNTLPFPTAPTNRGLVPTLARPSLAQVGPPPGRIALTPPPNLWPGPRRGPGILAVPANIVGRPSPLGTINVVPRFRSAPGALAQPGTVGLALGDGSDGSSGEDSDTTDSQSTAQVNLPPTLITPNPPPSPAPDPPLIPFSQADNDKSSVAPADDTLGNADPQIEDKPAAKQAAEDYANAFSKSSDAGTPSDSAADAPPGPMPEPPLTTGEDDSDAEGSSESSTGASPGTSPGSDNSNTPGGPETGQPQPRGSGTGSSSGRGDPTSPAQATRSNTGQAGSQLPTDNPPPVNGQRLGTTAKANPSSSDTFKNIGLPVGSAPATGGGIAGAMPPLPGGGGTANPYASQPWLQGVPTLPAAQPYTGIHAQAPDGGPYWPQGQAAGATTVAGSLARSRREGSPRPAHNFGGASASGRGTPTIPGFAYGTPLVTGPGDVQVPPVSSSPAPIDNRAPDAPGPQDPPSGPSPGVTRGTSGVNIDDAVKALDEKALPPNQFKGQCSYWVAKAINAGLPPERRLTVIDTSHNGPANGGDMGRPLEAAGFANVTVPDYSPQKGDVAVTPPFYGDTRNGGKGYGHVAMYNGKEWISDARQGGNPRGYGDTYSQRDIGRKTMPPDRKIGDKREYPSPVQYYRP